MFICKNILDYLRFRAKYESIELFFDKERPYLFKLNYNSYFICLLVSSPWLKHSSIFYIA